jgi:hypothetical protein
MRKSISPTESETPYKHHLQSEKYRARTPSGAMNKTERPENPCRNHCRRNPGWPFPLTRQAVNIVEVKDVERGEVQQKGKSGCAGMGRKDIVGRFPGFKPDPGGQLGCEHIRATSPMSKRVRFQVVCRIPKNFICQYQINGFSIKMPATICPWFKSSVNILLASALLAAATISESQKDS